MWGRYKNETAPCGLISKNDIYKRPLVSRRKFSWKGGKAAEIKLLLLWKEKREIGRGVQFFLVYLFRSDYGNGWTLNWSGRMLRKTEEKEIRNVIEFLSMKSQQCRFYWFLLFRFLIQMNISTMLIFSVFF